MREQEVEELFARLGVVLRGHFALSSGAHSDTYLQLQRALSHPRAALALGAALARKVTGAGPAPDVVASPALGGVLAGFAVAAALDCRFVFAERRPGQGAPGVFTLRRGQAVGRGERVLVVEDVVTTGGSALEVAALVAREGAVVTGLASIVDRSGGLPPERRPDPSPVSLVRVAPQVWDPATCPDCARGTPIDRPGSRTSHIKEEISRIGQENR
jgi:orotate phosphoribosyltransferase